MTQPNEPTRDPSSEDVTAPFRDAPVEAMPASVPRGEAARRYRLLRERRRGGMGAIHEALDLDLGRPVAIKAILEQHRDHPGLVARFLEEARIAGGLQHPGIVPVYEVGTLPDSRPFFAMKLVEGRTLSELLAARESPGEELPHFLGIFEQVCQTVAYAHSKGIIHRDLKPANIMVGEFGEVQVMDWGLAKALDAPAGDVLPAETPGLDLHGATTLPGSIFGTPAYIAPEQARGEVDRLDRRSDVFGLGAILCEILTGLPPFAGAPSSELLRLSAGEEVEPARERLRGCGADAPVVELALRCLEPMLTRRPADAGAVARTMTEYLEAAQERARQAELARAEAQVRAAGERKARRLIAALAGLALLVVIAGGLVWRWYERDQLARQEQARQTEEAVRADLREVARWRDEARAAQPGDTAPWARALAAARRAEGRLPGEGMEELREEVRTALAGVEQEQADRALLARLDEIRLSQVELRQQQLDLSRAAAAYHRVFREAGLDVLGLSEEEAARRLRGRAIRAELASALLDWAELPGLVARQARLRRLADAADPDPARRALRRALAARDRPALLRVARERADQLSALESFLLGRALGQLGEVKASRSFLRQAQRRHPRDFWVNYQFAIQLAVLAPQQPAEAVRFYTVAASLNPNAPAVHLNLGHALAALGASEEAIATYRKAIRLKPDYALAHYNLANILAHVRRHEEAIAEYQEALRLRPDYVEAHNNLGLLFTRLGRVWEALESHRQALRYQPRHVKALVNIGVLLAEQGDFDHATAYYRRALALDASSRQTWNNLGVSLRGQKDEVGAEAAFRRALKLGPDFPEAIANLGELLSQRGKHVEAIELLRRGVRQAPGSANIHYHLAGALHHAGRLDEAAWAAEETVARAGKSTEAWTRLGLIEAARGRTDRGVAALKKVVQLRPGSAEAWLNLGDVLLGAGRKEARVAYREALHRAPSFLPHLGLGMAWREDGRPDLALRHLGEAARLNPGHFLPHFQLGLLHLRAGHPDRAVWALRQAARRNPAHPEIPLALAEGLSDLDELDEAAAVLRVAVKKHPGQAKLWQLLALLAERRGDRAEAIAALRQDVRLRPTSAHPHCLLGQLLVARGEVGEGARILERGHALGVLTRGWSFPSREWLAEAERMRALEPRLEELREGKWIPMEAQEKLAAAWLLKVKGHPAAAARLYRSGLEGKSELPERIKNEQRIRAARAAALAGGEWREQALAWLRADLKRWPAELKRRRPEERERVAVHLGTLLREPDLAGVRDESALARLPEAERLAWRRLWAEVAGLRRSARGR